MFSLNMQQMDKENLTVDLSMKSSPLVQETTRTPLQDVNTPRTGTHKSFKKLLYSKITPYSTPLSKTPYRRKSKARGLIFEDQEVPGGDGVLLNTLIQNKVLEIISKTQKEFEEKLLVKDAKIEDLEAKLRDIKLDPEGQEGDGEKREQKSASDQEIDTFVDGLITYTSKQVLLEKIGLATSVTPWPLYDPEDTELENIVQELVEKVDRPTEEKQQDDYLDDSIRITPWTTVASDSPTESCTSVDRLASQDDSGFHNSNLETISPPRQQCTEAAETVDSALQEVSPSTVTDAVAIATPTKVCEDILKKSDTDKKNTQDTGVSPISVAMATTCTMVTPIKWVDVSQMTTPKVPRDTACSPIPLKLTDSETMVTPVKQHEAGQMTSPVVMATTETMTTPLPKKSDFCVGTSPFSSCSVETMTSPFKLESTDLCSSCVHSTDITVENKTTETMVTPKKQSSVKMCDATTVTSPLSNAIRRLSGLNCLNMSQSQLVRELETAAISNELLREEVFGVYNEKARLAKQLAQARLTVQQRDAQLEKMEARIVEAKEESMASAQQGQEDLEARINEQRATIERLEKQQGSHQREVDKLKQQNENLQDDLMRAYKKHKKETSELHDEYKANDYKPHFDHAQQKIRELEAELQEYMSLFDTVEKAHQLKEELHSTVEDAFQKIKQQSEKLQLDKEDAQKQRCEMERKMEENEVRACSALQQYNQMKEEYDSMKSQLLALTETQQKQEELIESSKTEMSEAVKKSTELQEQITAFKEDLEFRDYQVAEMKLALEESQEKEQAGFMEVQSLQAAMRVQEKELKVQEDRNEKAEERLKALNESLKAECGKFDGEVTSIRISLEAKDAELKKLAAVLSESQALVKKQRALLMTQDTRLQNTAKLESQLRELQKNYECAHSQAQETKDFLEQERSSLSEGLSETESKYKETASDLARHKKVLYEKVKQCEKMEALMQELSENLQLTQCELDSTKAQAHFMLLSQGEEIQEANVKVTQLMARLGAVLETLQDKADSMAAATQTRESVSSPTSILGETFMQENVLGTSPECTRISKPQSLLSSVLNALHDSQTPHAESHDISAKSSAKKSTSDSMMDICSPSNDKDISLMSADQSQDSAANQSDSVADSSTNQQGASPSTKEDANSLIESLSSVSGVLSQIIRKMTAVEKMANERLQALEDQNECLKEKFQAMRGEYESKIASLKTELLETSEREQAYRADLFQKKTELGEMEQSLKYSHAKISDMASNLDRFSDQQTSITKLSAEVAKLTKTLQLCEGEKKLSEEQLEVSTRRLDELSSGGGGEAQPMGQLLRDNFSLKKELHRVKQKLMEKKEEFDQITAKGQRRLTVLQNNWKKAEDEVYRLDEFVERMRKTLDKYRSEVSGMEGLLVLLAELDGEANQTQSK